MKDLFAIRHYNPEKDLSSLSRLLTEIESIDHDGEETSEDYLRDALTWPNFRPTLDAWVAEFNGKLVGYASALERPSQDCTLYMIVHPAQRRKGLGSQLLALALDRARELGSKNILIYANKRNQGSDLFLKRHHFQPVGSSGFLKLDSQNEIPSADFPGGFKLKMYSEVNDPLLLLQALNDCYRGMWGHGHNEHPSEEERTSPRFLRFRAADDIFLLFNAKNSICGFCSVKAEATQDEEGKWIDVLDGPGLVPEYRQQGYQRLLILHSIRHLRKRGNRTVHLEFYGDDENVLDIYRALGFTMVNQYVAYHQRLD